MTGPIGIVLAATLLMSDATISLWWQPDPQAIAYRVYVCQHPEATCFGIDFARFWVLLGQFAEPRVSGPRPDRPTWVAIADVYPGLEIIRIGETVYIRPGPRYIRRPS